MAYLRTGEMEPKGWIQLINEIEQGSDRTSAIVGGSFLETELENKLIECLHPDKIITNELFRPTGAFGPFATKIRVAKLVGLFRHVTYKDFMAIKDIRNAFAHRTEIHSFCQQPVCNWAANLTLIDQYSAEAPTNEGGTKGMVAQMQRTGAWIFREGRNKQIKTPRGRFVLSIQVLSFGLSFVSGTTMPSPKF